MFQQEPFCDRNLRGHKLVAPPNQATALDLKHLGGSMPVSCTSNTNAFGNPVRSAIESTRARFNHSRGLRRTWTIGGLFGCLAILVWAAPAQTIDHSGGF